jgi:hypothetical protein
MPVDFKPLTLTPINFSLTAGTSIPAPPDSPPRTPNNPQSSILGDNGASKSKLRLDSSQGSADSKLAPPLSPMSATSQDSQSKNGRFKGVRKFLSIRSHQNKLQKSPPKGSELKDVSRPTSPLSAIDTASVNGDASPNNNTLKHKRSNGWFNTASGRRKSGMVVIGRLDERITPDKNAPPPPSIPELNTFGTEAIGGEELFKNIGNNITVEDLEKQQKAATESAKSTVTKETKKPAKEAVTEPTATETAAIKEAAVPAQVPAEKKVEEVKKDTPVVSTPVTEPVTKADVPKIVETPVPAPEEAKKTVPAVVEPTTEAPKAIEKKDVEQVVAKPETVTPAKPVEPVAEEKVEQPEIEESAQSSQAEEPVAKSVDESKAVVAEAPSVSEKAEEPVKEVETKETAAPIEEQKGGES